MNDKAFVTGVDSEHQHFIKWWVKNIRKHNPSIDIVVCNFGNMKPEIIKWVKQNTDKYIEFEPHEKCAWFHKTSAIIECPYKYTCWMDVDCEVIASMEDIFDLAEENKLGLTDDIGRLYTGRQWYATGLVNVINTPDLLLKWHEEMKHYLYRGDQETLDEMLRENPKLKEEIVMLPQDYQWLRISLAQGKNSNSKRMVHWTGTIGKAHIKNKLMQKDDFNFET
jgi:hypothetical protein